eukprot:1030766-Pyramimonas_sp.AAC.1
MPGSLMDDDDDDDDVDCRGRPVPLGRSQGRCHIPEDVHARARSPTLSAAAADVLVVHVLPDKE